ncbi:MAG TPA: hypothetical protein VFC68_02175 [Treponemataceae bacterium]|nr:hypothetical protein [Treponemataceae bacterium]
MLKMKEQCNTLFFLCVLFFFTPSASPQNNESLNSARKSFLRGNFSDKLHVINSIPEDSKEQESLITDAARFVLAADPFFIDDEEFLTLASAIIRRCNPEKKEDVAILETMYAETKTPELKLTILTTLTKNKPLSEAITQQILEYLNTIVFTNKTYTAKHLENTLKIAKKANNPVFFPVFFETYSKSEDSTIKNLAKEGIDSLAPEYKEEVVTVLKNNPVREKLLVLDCVLQNDKNSDGFKAEIAEYALRNAILQTGNVADTTPAIVDLQLTAVKTLQTLSWTRSASTVENFFDIATKEFEHNIMNEEQFIISLSAFADLVPTNASIVLTNYLGTCNSQLEANGTFSKPVVLAVIQTLGNLGNRVAFDNLLYATYLEYPETILSAARDALVKLKW